MGANTLHPLDWRPLSLGECLALTRFLFQVTGSAQVDVEHLPAERAA